MAIVVRSPIRPGYTLIEVVVAVALVAFLAAFSVPTYQLILAQLQLNSATEQAVDVIRLAQQKTVTEQQPYGLTFTVGAGSIPLFLYNSQNGSKTTQQTLTLPSYISINSVSFSGNSDVRFAPSGAPTVSGNLVLYDSMRGRHRRIEIRPSGSVVANTAEY